MDTKEDHIPLQEVVYKPTTQTTTPTALKPESSSSSSAFLYCAATVVNILAFTSGIGFGWTSPVLPKLSSNDTTNNPIGHPITPSEESWIAGLVCLGAMFGPVIAAPISDKMGRKRTLLMVSCPMVVSLVMSAYVTTVPLFYVARLLIGVGIGSCFTVLPIYLAEISEDHNRGTIGCTFGMSLSIGLLFSFVVGPFLSIQNFCLLCAMPLFIFVVVFSLWIPETPQFLASVKKNKEVEVSLSKLRGKAVAEVQGEVAQITKAVLEDSLNKARVTDLFKVRGLRKGLIITLGLVGLQQSAGINAVLAYMQTIFDATGSKLKPEISTIIVAVIQTLSIVATTFLVERLGRRILLIASVIGSAFSLFTLGLFFYLKSSDFNVDGISWLPISSLIVFIITFNAGLGPLPWAVMAELFPANIISVAASLTSVTAFGAAFVVTLLFPSLVLAIGMAKSFWSFALVCFAGTIFIYWVLPETKGKSLQEIQRILEGNES